MNSELSKKIKALRNDKTLFVTSIVLRKSAVQVASEGTDYTHTVEVYYQYHKEGFDDPMYKKYGAGSTDSIKLGNSQVPPATFAPSIEDYNFLISYIEDWLGASIEEFTEGRFDYVR